MSDYSDAEILAFLDEMLPAELAAALERDLRESVSLQRRAAELLASRDSGSLSVGDVWRRHRLSCPSRSELTSFVLGVLDPQSADYIQFHITEIGCRVCQANRDDLQQVRVNLEGGTPQQSRRQRFFESSAGLLRSNRHSE